MTRRCPVWIALGEASLLASVMTATGTPWRCAMLSTGSPGATVMAVPPSQLHCPDEVGLRTTDAGAAIEPVISGLGAGLYGAGLLAAGLWAAEGFPGGFAAGFVG